MMTETSLSHLLADAVLTLHLAVAAFVVGGPLGVLLGRFKNWHWVDNLWWRLAHLAAIAVVVAESWTGLVCPLTTLEMGLRRRASATTYEGGFVEHWIHQLLFYNAPAWVFTLSYSVFGLVVLATWWYFPPSLKPGREPRKPGPS